MCEDISRARRVNRRINVYVLSVIYVGMHDGSARLDLINPEHILTRGTSWSGLRRKLLSTLLLNRLSFASYCLPVMGVQDQGTLQRRPAFSSPLQVGVRRWSLSVAVQVNFAITHSVKIKGFVSSLCVQ